MDKIEILINNKKIIVPTYLSDKCDKYNVDLTGRYSDKIVELHFPYTPMRDFDYLLNIESALYDKVYMEKYGPFVQIDNGIIVGESFDLYELLKKDIDQKYIYNFSYFNKKKLVPQLIIHDFFGSKIKTIHYSGIENEPRPYMLNDIIKSILKLARKYLKDGQKMFDEYLRWRCFGICRELSEWSKGFGPKDYQLKTSEKEYDIALNNLLNRYSVNNKTLFEKAKSLTGYSKNVGIYVLCIKSKRMIYIGQTKSSLYKRVLEHFNSKSSGFDNSILPTEVNEIYILKTPNIKKMIDLIESDCIAVLGKNVAENANRLAGSFSLETVNDKSYNPNTYLLNGTTLKEYVNEIVCFNKQ